MKTKTGRNLNKISRTLLKKVRKDIEVHLKPFTKVEILLVNDFNCYFRLCDLKGCTYIRMNLDYVEYAARRQKLDFNIMFQNILAHEYGHFLDMKNDREIYEDSCLLDTEQTAWGYADKVLSEFNIPLNERIAEWGLSTVVKYLKWSEGI